MAIAGRIADSGTGNWAGAETSIAGITYTYGIWLMAVDHEETGALDLDAVVQGQTAQVITVNRTTDAYERATAANLITAGADDILVEAGVCLKGVWLKSNDLINIGGDDDEMTVHEEATFQLVTSNNYIVCGTLRFVNCDFIFDASLSTSGAFQCMTNGGTFVMDGGSISGAGISSSTELFRDSFAEISLTGVDLSGLNAATKLQDVGGITTQVYKGCRFPASWEWDSIGEAANAGKILYIDCTRSTTPQFHMYYRDSAGTIEQTNAYRIKATDFALNGGQYSYAVNTRSYCHGMGNPLKVAENLVAIGTTGSKTFSFRILANHLMYETDAFVGGMFAKSASDSIMEWVSGQPALADFIAGTETALTTDPGGTSAWEDVSDVSPPTGTWYVYKVSLTVTVHQLGNIPVALMIGESSSTGGIYVHPVCEVVDN